MVEEIKITEETYRVSKHPFASFHRFIIDFRILYFSKEPPQILAC